MSLKKIYEKLRKDRADSIVSAIIVFPIMASFLITGVDYSIFMGNRGRIQGIARDSARTVAIMGGNGIPKSNLVTPIQKAYGTSRSKACSKIDNKSIAYGALNDNSSSTECQVIKALTVDKGLVDVSVSAVQCTPQVATSIGAQVTCTVTWEYDGIPGSILTFIRPDPKNNFRTSPIKTSTTGSSESEVRFDTSDLVSDSE